MVVEEEQYDIASLSPEIIRPTFMRELGLSNAVVSA